MLLLNDVDAVTNAVTNATAIGDHTHNPVLPAGDDRVLIIFLYVSDL